MTCLAGKEQLRELGITTVYDLRSDTEIEKYKTPCPNIEGIDVVRIPVFKLEDYSPEMMAKCVSVGCPDCLVKASLLILTCCQTV